MSPPAPFLPVSGSPAVPWSRWLDAFDIYCQAAQTWTPRPEGDEGLTPETTRLATVCRNLLLHLLGFEGQRIAKARNAIVDGHTFWQTRDLLTTVFGDRPNVMLARHRFRERQQLPGEDAVTFVAALRELSATCNYGALADEMIRDQLAQKTSSTRIRERLLTEDAARLTLDQAIVIASTIEDAAAGSKAMAAANTPGTVQAVKDVRPRGHSGAPFGKKPQHQAGGTCQRCGRSHDAKAKCPAHGKKCNNCGKLNHFSRCCRSKALQISTEETVTIYAVHGSDEIRAELLLGNGLKIVSLMVDCGPRCHCSMRPLQEALVTFICDLRRYSYGHMAERRSPSPESHRSPSSTAIRSYSMISTSRNRVRTLSVAT